MILPLVLYNIINKRSGDIVEHCLSNKDIICPLWDYDSRRIGMVNRIDRPVTGIFIQALSNLSLIIWLDRFRSRMVRKSYLCIVTHNYRPRVGIFNAHIIWNHCKQKATIYNSLPKDGKQYRDCITMIRCVSAISSNTSLLLVRPITGRRHQIRAHLEFLQCPIYGDIKYGSMKHNLPEDNKAIALHSMGVVASPFYNTMLYGFASPHAAFIQLYYQLIHESEAGFEPARAI